MTKYYLNAPVDRVDIIITSDGDVFWEVLQKKNVDDVFFLSR